MLKWRQVNFEAPGITVGKSKTQSGEGRFVPLSQTALQTLKDWQRQFPASVPEHYVFPRESYATSGVEGKKGFPIGSVTMTIDSDPTDHIQTFARSWRTAKKAANVQCRWHDLRHTFVSLISAGGAVDGITSSRSGWAPGSKMIQHYSHPRNQAKHAAVAVLDKLNSTNTAQNDFGEDGETGLSI